MISNLAQAGGFIALSVLLGRGLRSVLHVSNETPRERRMWSRAGVALVVLGIAAVIVAVVRCGQQITAGVLLTLLGSFACAVGALMVMEARDA